MLSQVIVSSHNETIPPMPMHHLQFKIRVLEIRFQDYVSLADFSLGILIANGMFYGTFHHGLNAT